MSKIKFRRETNDENPKHLHLNILASLRPDTLLKLGRVRRFARRTRDFCRAYRPLAKSPEGGGACVDRNEMIKGKRKLCKAHRNIVDLEPGFNGRH